MSFTFTVGDLAMLVAVVFFVARLESVVKTLKTDVAEIKKTITEFLTLHIIPINKRVIAHDDRLDDHASRIEKLESIVNAFVAKLKDRVDP